MPPLVGMCSRPDAIISAACAAAGASLAANKLRVGHEAHGRKADERAVGRERRCEHARRRAADAIKRQAELSLTDSRFDPFRDIRRVDDDDVSADRLKLGHELRTPDDVDGLQAARFRERDHPPPDTGIGGAPPTRPASG